MINSWWWIAPLLIEVGLRVVSLNRLKFSVILATLIYGVVLTIARIVMGIVHHYQYNKAVSRTSRKSLRAIAASSTDAVSTYRLAPMEVVMGLDQRNRPIKVDFSAHHTLIAGTTGGGKTNIINSILVQLFKKGGEFTKHCDVVLIDLKGHHEEDHLHRWAPLLREYYSVSTNYGGVEEAIARLEEISEDLIHKPKSDKHMILLIDEVAAMTDVADATVKGRAHNVLVNLASRGRGRMTLIIATQYPQYRIIPRAITSNLDRKIGLWVDDHTQAELIFRFRPKERLPELPGEFLIRDPASRKLKSGKAFLVHLPGEIDNIVGVSLEEQLEDDPRVKLYASVCATLKVSDKIPGVNKAYRSNELGLTHKQVGAFYRNYAMCGALDEPKTRGESYKMSMTYKNGIESIRARIATGQWQEDPETFV